MKYFPPQLTSILAIYCFCMLPTPSSGFPQPLSDPPEALAIVQLEQLAYCLNQWATLSIQSKVKKISIHMFLFHYSRSQEPTHPVKTEFPPVHPLMRLAAKLANRRLERFLQPDSGAAAVDFTKKDYAATLGRPFFLFRPRNGRNTED
uniref:Neuromedin-S n=1 Tax=Loxodonta africana TaxID=9785 RepID=G3U9H9_LOXAF